MNPQWAETWYDPERARYLLQGVATCDNCARSSMAVVTEFSPGSSGDKEALGYVPDANISWLPRRGDSPDFVDVPEHIAAAAKEAHSAASIHAVMAAILMARTVVEATAKNKEIVAGMLVSKIDAMATQGLIRESTKEAAHEIRHFGNDMAHGDIEDLPSSDDVDEVLSLMDEVLNEVFQGPARTARIRAKRTGSA